MTFGNAEIPEELVTFLKDFDGNTDFGGNSSSSSNSGSKRSLQSSMDSPAYLSSSSSSFANNMNNIEMGHSGALRRTFSSASSDSIDMLSDDINDTIASTTASSPVTTESSLNNDESSVSNAQLTALKPRFRISRRRINLFPRIIKKDIRRDYAAMFTNVLNTVDPVLMSKFMNTYCVNSVKMIDYAKLPQNVDRFPVLTVDGVPNIMGRAYTRICNNIPDFVFRLQSSHIKQHLYEAGSKVVFKARIQGSNLMKCFISMVENDNQALYTMAGAYYAVLVKAGLVPPLLEMGNDNDGAAAAAAAGSGAGSAGLAGLPSLLSSLGGGGSSSSSAAGTAPAMADLPSLLSSLGGMGSGVDLSNLPSLLGSIGGIEALEGLGSLGGLDLSSLPPNLTPDMLASLAATFTQPGAGSASASAAQPSAPFPMAFDAAASSSSSSSSSSSRSATPMSLSLTPHHLASFLSSPLEADILATITLNL
eukprot:gene40576-49469_t